MKYFFVCNLSQNVVTFRQTLIRDLIAKGHEVAVAANDAIYKKEIEALGAVFYAVGGDNRSLNIFKTLSYKKQLRRLIRRENPDAVLTFQLKANTFGVFAAKKAGVKNVYAFVEGAGEAFVNRGLKWAVIRKVVCFLQKRSFKKCERVFFLNHDDEDEFLRLKLVRPERCEVLHGVGVDTDKFFDSPMRSKSSFLMVARMVKSKGVLEYFEAARLAKKKYPHARFAYVGAQDTMTLDDVKPYIDDGIVEYCGETDDVRPYYENCSVLVLPSYREGLPMSVLEAESMGRAVLATDVVGCREAVQDGYNGFLVQFGEGCAERLAERMAYFIEHPDVAEGMGKNGRALAEGVFDERLVNARVMQVIGATGTEVRE